MIPDWVVGEVGFGNNFAPETDFYRDRCRAAELEIKDLEAEVAELVRQRTELREVLKDCAALSTQVSDRKCEILLATAPKTS